MVGTAVTRGLYVSSGCSKCICTIFETVAARKLFEMILPHSFYFVVHFGGHRCDGRGSTSKTAETIRRAHRLPSLACILFMPEADSLLAVALSPTIPFPIFIIYLLPIFHSAHLFLFNPQGMPGTGATQTQTPTSLSTYQSTASCGHWDWQLQPAPRAGPRYVCTQLCFPYLPMY